ncbi:FHIPEP family type III secretion protein [Sphingomonas sp. BN140010]|uniref:FHIPEP family type III secretion protein n=1 Tax=Sphingomonas arvum TaxID=2992113 RepID=A0ABT3JJA5_9SPHN|nr:FHIPEP family type III secretion protein [Sphingomonas sp. BN140010]
MINGVGFVIIFACVFGSFIASGGKLEVVLEALPHELTAILGAAIGAFLVANSLPTAKLAGKGLVRAFKGPRWTSDMYRDLLTLLFALLTTFKKGGATGIEPHLDEPEGSPIFSRHPKILADHHLIEFLCDYSEAQKLLTDVHKEADRLVADLVPGKISISGVQRVLQNLLGEGVSIRDIPTILEGIAEAVPLTGNLSQITEHVRARLARQISAACTIDGAIPVVTLAPEWDQAFADAIIGECDARQLAMAPSALQAFMAGVRETFDRLAQAGEIPCLLVNPSLRPFVRSIIERVRPATVVLSQSEIHVRARIRSLGSVGGAATYNGHDEQPVLAAA